ncbi:unnamed protein product [Closterium sp. NIES-54]
MYGSSSRPFTVEELLDRLRRAAGDRCGVAVDQGARQPQLTGRASGVPSTRRSSSTGVLTEQSDDLTISPGIVKVDRVTCSASSAEARERRRGRDGKGDFGLASRSRCGSSGADNSRRMHNGASRANLLHALASVRTAVFYGATLDSRSAAALAYCRPAVLAGRLSAVLARLLCTTLAGGRLCGAVSRPG